MATLKFELNHLDYIMDKIDHKKLYMVLHTEMHNVWVIKDGGGEPPFELPKRIINLSYVKVDPKVARVLYAENDKPSDTEPSIDTESKSE